MGSGQRGFEKEFVEGLKEGRKENDNSDVRTGE